jgi:hypothetical protein
MWKLLRSRGLVRAPWVGRGGDCRLVPGRSPSPKVGRSGVRRLLGPSPSPSPGSGEAEIVVSWGRAQVRALGRARRRSLSSGAEPESEPWVGRGGVSRLPGLSPSPSPGSGGVRRLPRLSPSPSPGSSGVRRLPGLSPSPSPGSGGVRRLPGLSPSPSPGSGGAEFAVFLWSLRSGLTACQSHSVKWHRSRSGAGGAVLLSGRSVERRSDGGHFGSAGWGARVRIRVSGHLCIKCSCDLSIGAAIWSGLLLSEGRASGEPGICSPLKGGLGRDGNPPGSAALV